MAKYLIPMLFGIMMVWSCDGERLGNKKIKSLSIITTVYNPDSNSIDSTKLLYEYDRQGKKVHFITYDGEPNGALYLNSSEEYRYNPSGDLNEVIRLDKERSPYIAVSYKYDFGNNIKIEHWSESGELTAEILKQFNKRDQLISKFTKSIIDSSEKLDYYQYDDQGRKIYETTFTQNNEQLYPECVYFTKESFDEEGKDSISICYYSSLGSSKFLYRSDSTENGILKWVNTLPGKDWQAKNPGIDSLWVYDSFTEYDAEGRISRIVTYQNMYPKKIPDESLDTLSIHDQKSVLEHTALGNNFVGSLFGYSYSPNTDIRGYATSKYGAPKNEPNNFSVTYKPSHITTYNYFEGGYTKVDSSIHADHKIEKSTYDQDQKILMIEKSETIWDYESMSKDGQIHFTNNVKTKIEYIREYY
ncbi:MAG: hypothetical protein ISR95_02805 [Candidatus Marinimicrobia bacterium]|nr:hypothetical protein [Candidatus Neomarinimicrobiota bacterium]